MTKGIRWWTAACLVALGLAAHAESVTYRIVEYNDDAGDFTLAAHGMRPVGSYALFENEFGATRGNRYNQIPRNREATLWLMGWDDCVINSVTLWMCSNNSSGTAALTVKASDATLFTMPTAAFDNDAWFGHWVSKDLQTYVAVTKEMTQKTAIAKDAEVSINIKGGTQEGSVYLDAVTIDYDAPQHVATESPLGWVFEKLEAKSTLADGDVVMLYRSGDAAGDIDGMQTSHYLDAIGLSSTSNVSEPFVEFFTANKTTDGHWTLTDQYGQQLGAKGAQSLAWDEGITTWDITLGYSGATIASTNTKYGTLRYNAPVESYPRFWNYTSTSLPLPYLYRRTRQLTPVVSTGLTLPCEEREVCLADQDTLLLRATLLPATTADQRIAWASSDEEVATVKSGIVFLQAAGTALITATSYDGGSTATCRIIVKEPEDAIPTLHATEQKASARYDLNGKQATTAPRHGIYIDTQGLHYQP